MGAVLMWVLLAVAVGMLAGSRGRSGGAWCLISLVISPLLGFIFLMVQPNLAVQAAAGVQPGASTHVKCPKCAEWVLPDAVVCKHCGAALEPQPVDRAAIDRRMNAMQDAQHLKIAVVALVLLGLMVLLLSRCAG